MSEPAFHDDGSRTWRFVPSADPRKWSDLGYIDEHIGEVKDLGWIEDNPEGYHWTVEEAVQAYEQWAEEATRAYRTVVDENDQVYVDPYVPVAERPVAPPMDIAAVTAEAYAQPAAAAAAPSAEAPAGVGYGDVMAELRSRVPENDGQWTATRAAGFDNDQAFLAEQGITAAQDRASTTAGSAIASDGTVTVEGYNRMTAANSDLAHAVVDADSSRNRYQQTTGYDRTAEAAAENAAIDEQARVAREYAAADPEALGLGLSYEQQMARADVYDYMNRTGQQLDPAVPLSTEQRAWLEQARQAEFGNAGQDDVTPEEGDRRWRERMLAQEEQAEQEAANDPVAASAARAAERMRTPTSERID